MDPRENAPVYTAVAVCQLLGISQTPDEPIAALGPPPDSVPGFLTFFDPGSSILSLRAIPATRGVLFPLSWYDHEPFAQAEDVPQYRQVRMNPVPRSTGKTFAEQLTLLAEGEEVPPARVVVAALVTHFLASGERLLPDVCARCADTTSRGDRVGVGSFDSVGLYVFDDWDVLRHDFVGLASSRKF